MPEQRRKFSNSEKQAILTQASARGVSKVLREHGLSYSVYTRWKQQLLTSESENKNSVLQNIADELRRENIRLKNIIANLVLELEIKSEELKTAKLQAGNLNR
jgi:putative transposase